MACQETSANVIKYGLLFVLFLALCYTTVPGAHILLVPEIETEPFVFSDDTDVLEELYMVNSDGSMITQTTIWTDNWSTHSFDVSKRAVNSSLEWTVNLESFPGTPDQFAVIEGDYGYTVNNNAWIWTLDKMTGEVLSNTHVLTLKNGTEQEMTPLKFLA